MKDKIINAIKGLSVVAILLTLLYVVSICIQYGNVLAEGICGEAKGLRLTMMAVALVSAIVMVGLTIAFFVNVHRSLQQGLIFPKKNFGVMVAMSIVLLVYLFCESNVQFICYGTGKLLWDLRTLFVPTFLLIMSLFYRLASIIAEENQLTI